MYYIVLSKIHEIKTRTNTFICMLSCERKLEGVDVLR